MIWIEVSDLFLIEKFKTLIDHNENKMSDEYKEAISVIRNSIYKNSNNAKIDISFLVKNFELHVEPDDELLMSKVRSHNVNSKVIIFISFRSPSTTIFKNNHPFLYIATRNRYFPQKEIEVKHSVPSEISISEKLGLKIIKPNRGFESIAGNFRLKRYINKIVSLVNAGFNSTLSALMFFGTAGSGKTNSAEAIAFELGYDFAYLDLPHFMSLPSPTRSLDEMFDFLQEQDNKTLLLIDEIEKMFDFTGNDLKSQNLFGKLLTKLNDIYADPSNKIIFIATANNIAPIIQNNPEFLRKGRFDEVFFLSYPNEDAVIELIELFIKNSNKDVLKVIEKIDKETIKNENMKILLTHIEKENQVDLKDVFEISVDADDIYRTVESVYGDNLKVSDDSEFIYSPPEILTVIKEMHKEAIFKIIGEEIDKEALLDGMLSVSHILKKNDLEMIENVISEINPLQVYASEGIRKQISQAESYTESYTGTKHENYKKG